MLNAKLTCHTLRHTSVTHVTHHAHTHDMSHETRKKAHELGERKEKGKNHEP